MEDRRVIVGTGLAFLNHERPKVPMFLSLGNRLKFLVVCSKDFRALDDDEFSIELTDEFVLMFYVEIKFSKERLCCFHKLRLP